MKLLVGLLVLQLCIAGFHIVSRVALDMGVSKIVYTVYRNIIAVMLLGPFAYFFEKEERPPLTFSLLVQLFLLALFGVTANQGFYLIGLYYTSPTFTSEMQNSVPAITFALASALRIEPINVLRKDGLAKVIGTILSVGGATIITLYKGPPLLNLSQQPLVGSSVESIFLYSTGVKNWTLGCIFLIGHCLSWSAWILLQAVFGLIENKRQKLEVVRKYPAKLSITTFTCLFGLLQFLVIAAFAETDGEHWKIHFGEELLTVLYAGVVATAVVYALQMWCIDKGGPIFVAVFQPVSTVLVAIMACLILGDQLYTGGIIGVILIIIGLYSVLWGRNEEKKFKDQGNEEILTRHLMNEKNARKESEVASNIP